MMARLKELGDENRRLKKMYAEERLKAEIIQEAMAKKWCSHHVELSLWRDCAQTSELSYSGVRTNSWIFRS